MKSVSMEKEIKEFPAVLREFYAIVQKSNWEKHNPARNAAQADYKNPAYIPNRLAADRAWIVDSDEIVDAFKKVSDYIKKSESAA